MTDLQTMICSTFQACMVNTSDKQDDPAPRSDTKGLVHSPKLLSVPKLLSKSVHMPKL